MHHRLAALLLTGLLGSGCASTLSSHQTAKPVDPGHFQVSGGFGFYTPLGPTSAIIGAGVRQAGRLLEAISKNEQYALSEEDQQELLTAGIALAALPPSPTTEISVRTGVVQNLDAGVRYSLNAVRLDAKYRFFHQDDGPGVPEGSQSSFDIAAGLGVSKYLFNNPLVDALQFVKLGNFDRWDLEVPLYISWESGDVFRFYGGPKYIFSRTTFDERLVNTSGQASLITGLDLSLPARVDIHFVGATVGIMVGYKYVFLILELTGGYTFSNPVVLGQRRDLGGATLFPNIGLALRF